MGLITVEDHPELEFGKETTDRLHILRSFSVRDDSSRSDGWAWSLFAQRLGPSLRNIQLKFQNLERMQLLQIATSSPHLAEAVLASCYCKDSYADVVRFIELDGPSLIRLELRMIEAAVPEADTLSVVFEALARYGKSIEVLRLKSVSCLNEKDLRVFARPGSLPRLKKLTIGSLDCDFAGQGESAKLSPCQDAIAAVLESRQTTLD